MLDSAGHADCWYDKKGCKQRWKGARLTRTGIFSVASSDSMEIQKEKTSFHCLDVNKVAVAVLRYLASGTEEEQEMFF